MKTLLIVRSSAFPPMEGEEEELINDGMFAKAFALFLRGALSKRGYEVGEPFCEDWGWCLEIENEAFPLSVGCTTLDDDEFYCAVYPDRPVIRRWFRKIETRQVVETLVNTLYELLKNDPKIENVEFE